MKAKLLGLVMLLMCSLMVTIGFAHYAEAGTGDLGVLARGNPDGAGFRDLLRVSSAAHLWPGNTTTQNLGSSSLKWGTIYGNDISTAHIHRSRLAITGNTTLTASTIRSLMGISTLSGNITVTMPDPTTLDVGEVAVLNDETGSADATHTATVNATGGATFDGASTATITSAYGQLHFYNTGTAYFKL